MQKFMPGTGAAISAFYVNAIQPRGPRLDVEPVVGKIAKAWQGISGARNRRGG